MTSVSDKLATQVYSQTLSVTKCLVFKCSLCVKKKKVYSQRQYSHTATRVYNAAVFDE